MFLSPPKPHSLCKHRFSCKQKEWLNKYVCLLWEPYLPDILVGLNAVNPGQNWTFVISGTPSIELACREKNV